MLKKVFRILVVVLLVFYSQNIRAQKNKVKVFGFKAELVNEGYLRFSGPRLDEYSKVSLWYLDDYINYNKTGDKKYKYVFKKEGYCYRKNGLSVGMSVQKIKYIFVVTKIVKGVIKTKKAIIDPNKFKG